jgi:penicillin amidase
MELCLLRKQSTRASRWVSIKDIISRDKSQTITQLLEPKSNWDKAAVGQMIYDNTSSVAQVVKQLISNLSQQALSSNEKEALAVLKKWKGSNNLTDVAPTLYNKWIYTYLKNTFEDELGPEQFKMLLGTHIIKQIVAANCK